MLKLKDTWYKPMKKVNPMGADGQRKTCVSCGSFRHMLSDCPDSWENMAVNNGSSNLEEANVCDVVLYIGG